MDWVLNILLPGVALIRRGRRDLGVLLAGLYILSLAIVVASFTSDGAVLPQWITVASAAAAGGGFVLAQIALYHEWSIRREPAWRLHVAMFRETIEAHLEHERYIDALLLVDEWLTEDPHNAEAWLMRARVEAAQGKAERARQDYRRAARFDADERFAQEIRDALEHLG